MAHTCVPFKPETWPGEQEFVRVFHERFPKARMILPFGSSTGCWWRIVAPKNTCKPSKDVLVHFSARSFAERMSQLCRDSQVATSTSRRRSEEGSEDHE
jgi:hypothetical protein